MKFFAGLLTFIVAALHFGFMVLEMFFWNHPVGQKVFVMTQEVAASSEVLAMNQGLYNGFLAVGLLWGLIAGNHGVKVYFLLCVLVAGVFGALTAKFSILFIQAAPALLALIVVIWAKNSKTAEQRIFS